MDLHSAFYSRILLAVGNLHAPAILGPAAVELCETSKSHGRDRSPLS